MPHVADFLDLVEVQVRNDDFFFIPRSFSDDFSARRTEITLAVKFSDIPWMLAPDAIDGANEISICDSMRGLLEFPQILAQSCDGCRRIEYDFRSVQSESSRALGEVPIVADVDADIGELRLEDGITQIPGFEIKLLPESRRAMRNVMLPIFPEVLAVGIDDGRRVVIDALDVLFVNRNDDRHAVFPGGLAHELNRGTVGNFLDHAVPARRLLCTEVRTGEDFLHAQDLCALSRSLIDQLQMFLDGLVFDFLERFFHWRGARGLN